MKISKIFAGMSAMAIASAMVISANANTIDRCRQTGKEDWKGAFITADGADDFVNAETFGDGDCVVTVHFNWTESGLADKVCSFKPAFANGWEALFVHNPDYVSGWALKDDLETDDDGVVLDENGDPAKYAIQNDGFFCIYDTSLNEVSFTISADCIADMKDYSSYGEGGKDGEDGSKWDGFLIQCGYRGIDITSVDFSHDGVMLNSDYLAQQAANNESKAESAAESKADDGKTDSKTDSKAEDSKAAESSKAADSSKAATTTTTKTTTTTTTTSAASSAAASDNTNQATGATAGLALAGLALAGAVAVVSKRK